MGMMPYLMMGYAEGLQACLFLSDVVGTGYT